MSVTIVKEIQRSNFHGYPEITWYCISCRKHMNLPQQQNFNYCFHCGSKVIQKIGGKEEPFEF